MALSIGIIGLPNVGKSTLFNALTGDGAEVSNYPFCTVGPNVGTVEVPDLRLERLSEVIQPQSTTPTSIRFVDIAGLVRGANQGAGLGNQFLAHIRDVDALVHVVRCFDDAQISHVDGAIDPLRDIETIETELLLADLAVMEKAVPHLDKVVRSEPRSLRAYELATCAKVLEGLQRGMSAAAIGLTPEERDALAAYSLLTAKPVLYAANVREVEADAPGPWVDRLVECYGADQVLVVSAQFEAEVAGLGQEERAEFVRELGLEHGGIERLVQAGYKLLDLITFYTLANGKLQAWQLPRGEKIPKAAGRIHTDMEKGFIRAELASWEQLITMGGWAPLKAAGQLRSEGRDYVVADGDVITFLFKA
ncbi:MAG: redox-regulated ATPase YchF [Gemmatimonadetes bacterium]|nr:redox-regulated ATPase YchF [Gemmatimonadota bacterium]MYC70527.1 redox-regulated ATPase YchF [Gemmatimonadota bacterium]MYI62315.1 redox-regulated ATPase YchF [Gemmatimonadota bacterium]